MHRYLADLQALHRGLVDLTTAVQVGDASAERLAALCLHLRILELSDSALAMLGARAISGIPHVVRGQLEALADLRNLSSDPQYLSRMEFAYWDQVRKVLQAASAEANPELRPTLEKATQSLADLKSRKQTSLNVRERFEAAGLRTEYRTVYSYLCSHSHNNLSALEERHVNKTAAPYTLRVFSHKIDEELAILVELSIRFPFESFSRSAQDLAGYDSRELDRLASELSRLREGWAPLVGR